MLDFIVISGSILIWAASLLSFHRCIVIPWIVKLGFCFIHYTVTLVGVKNVNCYIGNIVLLEIVMSGFHCIKKENIFSGCKSGRGSG